LPKFWQSPGIRVRRSGLRPFPLPKRVGTSFRLDPRFTVGVGYEHVDSTLDVYDDAGVTFSVGFTGWSR